MKRQITVLLADDNKRMRDTLKVVMTSMGNVTLLGEASNGEEVIQFAKEHSPDIILMDINMSPVNGFEATRKILKYNPDIKIIGVSLHTEPSYARNMLRLGAKGYITKSCPINEIIDAILIVAEGGQYIGKNIHGRL